MPKIIISDQNVINRYGFRVMTEGIETSAYMKNPVVFYEHNWRALGALPIGRTNELSVKDGQLIADYSLDKKDTDEKTQRIIEKIENGFLKGASIGINDLSWSDDPSVLLPEQRRSSVVKSNLYEWSFAKVPVNQNCVKLSYKGVLLSTVEVDEEMLNSVIPILQKNPSKMKEVAYVLGLAADADEKQIKEAVLALKKRSVDMLVLSGKAKGFINDGNEQAIRKLAETDYESTLSLIDAHKPAQAPAAAPSTEKKVDDKAQEEEKKVLLSQAVEAAKAAAGGDSKESRANWSFDDWSKKDPDGLLSMKRTQPAKYDKLADEYARTEV